MLRSIPTYELFTLVIIISIVFVALAKALFPKRFDDFILVLGNSNYLKIYAREQKFFDKFDALLFVNLMLSGAIFAFLCLQYNNSLYDLSINDLFKLSFGIGSFFLIKVLLERLIGSLFEIDELIDQYLFQKISHKNFIGLMLIPINSIFIYSFKPPMMGLYIIIGLLILINLIGLFTTIKTNQSLIKQNLFYFILYLCALEIAPYVILYKVLIS